MPLGPCIAVTMDVAPYRLSGTVYGALLNQRTALQSLGDAISLPTVMPSPCRRGLRSWRSVPRSEW